MESLNVNAKNWKALIKPAQLDVKISDDKSHAKIIAEPLEKGYGLTLGNSLRRILLSSIRGAAVTSIQIDGVLHEFTSIKGVREDVTDIVLNVKSLALKSSSDGTKKLILESRKWRVVPIKNYYWDFLTFCYNLVIVKSSKGNDSDNQKNKPL